MGLTSELWKSVPEQQKDVSYTIVEGTMDSVICIISPIFSA